MKEGWDYVNLETVCNIIGGGTPSKSKKEYYNGKYPWATVRDMNTEFLSNTELSITEAGIKNSSTNLIPKGNVIIATRVGLGKVCMLNQETAINQDLKGIIPKNDNVLSSYLFWWFKSVCDEIVKAGTGLTVQGVKLSFVKQLTFPLIPLEEQKQIVAILDKAFVAIDKAKSNIEKNIENAKELFQSKLNNIFSQKGDGWEEKTWKEVLEIRSGRNQKAVENPKGKYPILGSAGKIMSYADDYICEEGTTIIGRKGTINNPIFIEEKFWNVDTAFGLHALEGLNKKFLYFFCLSYDFTQRDKGSGRPSLVKNDLLKMKMNIPSHTIQNLVVAQCEGLNKNIEKLIFSYVKKQNELEDLKKSLLQKAFTGALTNKEVAV